MSFENISIKQVFNRANRENAILVDVRDEGYEEGHLPNAINIPLEDIENNQFDIDRNRVIIVYCEHGPHSMMAARILMRQGYRVLNVVGGIRQYRGVLVQD